MRLLLDTHSFLWFIGGDERISSSARASIADLDNEVFLSIASLWEIAIKLNLGKLKLPKPFEALIPEQLQHNEITVLNATHVHPAHYVDLPLHHRDPFDRLILAQAQVEQLTVISKDRAFQRYNIALLW